MGSKKEALNKQVRETISSLPDEALIKLVRHSPLDYTPFALQAAREELAKRKKLKSLRKAVSKEDKSQAECSSSDYSGCYIEIWRDKNFEGDYLLIEGPAEYETLSSLASSWADDICSLRVGPNAFVIAYENDGFTGEMICFGPCQEVADLSEFDFDDEIDSIKLINSVRIFEQIRFLK